MRKLNFKNHKHMNPELKKKKKPPNTSKPKSTSIHFRNNKPKE